MVSVDTKLLSTLQSSTCFGIAYDGGVTECKQCDVHLQCKVKSEKGILTTTGEIILPIEEKSDKPTKVVIPLKKSHVKKSPVTGKTPTGTPAKKDTPVSMPDFKAMDIEELKKMAVKYDVVFRDYKNDNINRMRLIMTLRKQFM